MNRQQEEIVVRLWRDWCQVWPEQYAHTSLALPPEGYDPVFDVIPSQAYKDFFLEVVLGHPKLRNCNPFEVIDAALNQTSAPEQQLRENEQFGVPRARVTDVELNQTPSSAARAG